MSKLSHSNREGNKHKALSKYATTELARKRTAHLLNDIGSISLVSMLVKAYLLGLEDAREAIQL